MGQSKSKANSLEQRTNELLERKLRRVSETRRETLHMLSRAPSLTSLSSRYSDTVDKDEIAKYEYPFENLVFEGGGAKGLAYCGVIRILEDIGVWDNVKRLAGTSAGAICAAMLAIGYDSHAIEEFLLNDLTPRRVFDVGACAKCFLLPNLVRYFGWHPGNRIMEYFGEKIEHKTGDADITFMQLYEMTGRELCIVVTNVNRMTVEYCHAKTTPDMPVRLAMRMSMGIPGLFQAKRYIMDGYADMYVDGGLLCNYPIHVFDGWWLSMAPEDSFLRRLHPLSALQNLYDKKQRFGTRNEKTLGILVYSPDDFEVMSTLLDKTKGSKPDSYRPNTKLYKKKLLLKQKEEGISFEHERVVEATNKFLEVLQKCDVDHSATIDLEELRTVFKQKSMFSDEDASVMFGKDFTVDDAFVQMDLNDDGQITYAELTKFIERNGVELRARFVGYKRKEIGGLFDFVTAIQDAMLINLKRVFSDDSDVLRTIGIDTDYVSTNDYGMEKEDRIFLTGQGKRATLSFFQQYIAKHELQKRQEYIDFPRNSLTLEVPSQSASHRVRTKESVTHLPRLAESIEEDEDDLAQEDGVSDKSVSKIHVREAASINVPVINSKSRNRVAAAPAQST